MKKAEFDFSTQIDDTTNSKIDSNIYLDKTYYEQKYIGLLHELIFHLYMAYDLNNLCKVITNFK